jgi:hypothetical protein
MFFCIAAVAPSLTAAAAYRPFFLMLVLGIDAAPVRGISALR